MKRLIVFLTALLMAFPVTTTIAQADPVTKWSVDAPKHGGVGKYGDTNVRKVWQGATHHERSTWQCIRQHEIPGGSYKSQNPVSTASGAGQWLNGTWDGLKKWVKVGGKFVAKIYDEAKDAPAWVQDAAFRHVFKRHQITGRGLGMWNGTGCPGT